MAQLENNNFDRDTGVVRATRFTLLQTNIDTHAAAIGIGGTLLQWAQACHTQWIQLSADAEREEGEAAEAFQEYRKKYMECKDYYQKSKDYLIAIIGQYGADDFIMKAYGIYDPTPLKREDILKAKVKWNDEHDKLVDAGDPRVIPQTVMDKIVLLCGEMETMWETARAESDEKLEAYHDKMLAFEDGTGKLRVIYGAATLVWGDDAIELRSLGFVPSSEVWTKHKPHAPKNFAYDEIASRFDWDKVEGVDSYEVDYRLTGASGDWTTMYEGADNFTDKRPPDAGEYDFRVRAIADGKLGAWSGVIVVNFSGGALAAPSNFKFDDAKQLFTWDFMELALLYQLEISRDEGQTWVQKYFDVDTYFNAGHLDIGKALARVRALDGYQEPGDWTEPLAVTFTLLAPAFLAYSQYKNEFVCNWVPLATGYEFEIYNDPGAIWEPLYNGPNNHFVYDLKFGDWKVRVRALRNQEHSDWTPAIVVNIIFVAPVGLIYDPSALKIKWDKVTDAAQYHLINETGTTSYIGADNHLDIELLAPEKFRVRAGDDTMLVWGQWSAWTMLG